MTHIEQLHLDAINDTEYELIKHSAIYQIDKDKAAAKSAEITENIACEFAKWLDDYQLSDYQYKLLFQEYLKTKENEAKIHMVK
jgi:hypothetical protein